MQIYSVISRYADITESGEEDNVTTTIEDSFVDNEQGDGFTKACAAINSLVEARKKEYEETFEQGDPKLLITNEGNFATVVCPSWWEVRYRIDIREAK